MKLKELADALNLSFYGNPDCNVEGVKDLASSSPISPNHIYYIASKKITQKYPHSSQIQIALTIEKLKNEFPNGLITDEKEAKVSFLKLLRLFEKKPNWGVGISDKASIHPSAKIGKNVRIMDFCVIGEEAVIGDNCILHWGVVVEPGAIIGENTEIRANTVIGFRCEIGKDCIIHSNTTIGADGFGFTDYQGVRYKIPQIGIVRIGDNVEIGAGCTIDRATIEVTSIGNHTKLDDQVHIGHNCRVGNYVYMAGASVLAGGVVIEDGCMIAGQTAIAEHLTIGKGSIVMGLTGVTKDLEPGSTVFGIPARPATEMLRIAAVLGELPDLIKNWKNKG